MQNCLSLFELNQHLRRVISYNMQESLWVKCEISEYKFVRSYTYLTLVERNTEQIIAKSSAVIWPRDLEQIKKEIGEQYLNILQAGQQVLLRVLVEFSELYGISLSVKSIDLSFSIGQLELKRLETLKKLESEHFFDLNRQLELGAVPQRIAVISSKDAAGLQDFLEQLHNNTYRYNFQTELFQSAVQGVNVTSELVQQIENIEKQSDCFDCIVIVRGGGAKIDLIGFDDFEVCKAIATCELPVLTGIGHDVDDTLADLVAHTTMKTPTAVADFLIQRLLNYEMQLNSIAIDLQKTILRKIKKEEQLLDKLKNALAYSSRYFFQQEQNIVEMLENRLQLMLPEKILKRGFVLLTDEEGNAIISVRQLYENQKIRIKFNDGDADVFINFDA